MLSTTPGHAVDPSIFEGAAVQRRCRDERLAANAVVDALAPLGIVDIDMPATSERVWRVMANCGKSQPAL